MTQYLSSKPNDRLAPKLTKQSLQNLQRLLVFIGKPFYLFLAYSIIAFALISFLVGHAFRFLVINIFKLLVLIYRHIRTQIKTLALKIKKLASKLKKLKRKTYKFYPLKLRLRHPKAPRFKIPVLKLPSLKIQFILATLLFVFSLLATITWQLLLKDLPSPEQLVDREIEVSTKIYDRNGVLLYNIYKDKNRTPVSLQEIPLRVRLATLAIEDAEFYQHPGFSVRGIARAALKNLKEGELTGGSTITQQLVKNTLLSPEKTVVRKLREIILAVQVEIKFSKDEILEMYLNEVSYGGTAYGIQEAARVYFGKDVDKLTLAEAALLAGLPKSPTKYSPFGSNPDLSLARQKEVINLMKIDGYITQEQLDKALDEKIVFAENRTNIKAPHFVMYLRELLEEKYGKEVVETGGLKVITTLDYQIQKMAEQIVRQEVEGLTKLDVGNGAVVVINPTSGEILAMVGSKDYFDTSADGNVNVTTRPRQPGSSIKIVNYAYALSNNYTPATILKDTPVKFLVEGQPPYTPTNYDNKFKGHLTLRSAFAQSRNVPAVKVLASYGVEKMIEMGKKMGISTWTKPSNYGLSLTLGGGEVTLLELSQVYATVANYGKKSELKYIQKITNFKDKVLEENTCAPSVRKSKFNIASQLVKSAQGAETTFDLAKAEKDNSCQGELVLDERVAFMLIDILKDNPARTPAFGSNSLLNIAGHKEVAVKTGTSNNLRDNLAIGFNQDYLVAVWVGNNDNSPMSRIASGITGATPIWNKIMSALLAEENNSNWQIPEGLVQLPFCTLTGTLPCQGCPTKYEWFLEENQPTKSCNPEVIKGILDKRKEAFGPEGQRPGGGELLDEAVSSER